MHLYILFAYSHLFVHSHSHPHQHSHFHRFAFKRAVAEAAGAASASGVADTWSKYALEFINIQKQLQITLKYFHTTWKLPKKLHNIPTTRTEWRRNLWEYTLYRQAVRQSVQYACEHALVCRMPNAGRYRQIYKSKNGTIYKLIIIWGWIASNGCSTKINSN